MRFIDLAAAALIGISSVTALIALNPSASDSNAAASAKQISLQETLFAYVEAHGLVWLQNSPFQIICSSLEESSASNYTLSALEGTSQCTQLPPGGTATAHLPVGGRAGTLELIAWSDAGA